MCAAHFSVQIGERHLEGRVEGTSSKDVSDVVRSILESKSGSKVTVTGIQGGAPPSEVSEIVLQGILDERFYLLTDSVFGAG